MHELATEGRGLMDGPEVIFFFFSSYHNSYLLAQEVSVIPRDTVRRPTLTPEHPAACTVHVASCLIRAVA